MMMLALTRTIPITEKRALLVASDNLATDLNLPSTVVFLSVFVRQPAGNRRASLGTTFVRSDFGMMMLDSNDLLNILVNGVFLDVRSGYLGTDRDRFIAARTNTRAIQVRAPDS